MTRPCRHFTKVERLIDRGLTKAHAEALREKMNAEADAMVKDYRERFGLSQEGQALRILVFRASTSLATAETGLEAATHLQAVSRRIAPRDPLSASSETLLDAQAVFSGRVGAQIPRPEDKLAAAERALAGVGS